MFTINSETGDIVTVAAGLDREVRWGAAGWGTTSPSVCVGEDDPEELTAGLRGTVMFAAAATRGMEEGGSCSCSG